MIAIHALVGGVSGRDFPSPLRRLLLCVGITPHICPPHRPDKNAYVERYHRTYGQECLQVHQPSTLQEVREVTEAFLQHYNEERPHQGRSCGNVPPRVAFPTLPTLPALPERVDPDAWLVPLDQKVYLRHVGRDGCVDVDLATYYLGPQMAGWSVLFQVEAQSRQFAVWHQDQVVKLLPVPRLGRPGDGPGRLSAVHPARGVGCSATGRSTSVQESPTAASLGGGSLISSFIRQLSQALALIGARAEKLWSLCWTKTRGTRNHLLHEQSLCLIAPSSSSPLAFFSPPSQLFPVLPLPFR